MVACAVGQAHAQAQPAQSPPAQAQPAAAAAEPTLEAKERARTAYARGQAAFGRGEYSQALAAFEAAYDAVPNPIVLLSVAESAAKLGQIERALAALDSYLQSSPNAADHAEVEQKRAALALTPVRLSLTSEPAGAEVLIDARATGKHTPVEFDISPGSHQLQLTLSGYQAEPETLQGAPGARVERAIVLHPIAPAPAEAALANPAIPVTPPPAAPVAPVPPPTATLWLGGSIGAAGLIAGTVLGVLALKERSDFDANPTASGADRGERLALFADVGFGIGAMALVTTVVLLVTHDEPKEPEQTARALPQLEVVPQVTRTGASASAKFRF
jgi:tetratricopeptide (TPR) repeat protein